MNQQPRDSSPTYNSNDGVYKRRTIAQRMVKTLIIALFVVMLSMTGLVAVMLILFGMEGGVAGFTVIFAVAFAIASFVLVAVVKNQVQLS